MRRLNQLTDAPDQGATIITFALALTMLMAFVGLGVDGAVFYAKQQEAQNGADAGALAIAQEYAVDGCVENHSMATDYAGANASWGQAGHVSVVDCASTNRVTVDTAATFAPFFTQVIGIPELTARGSATVEWGSPTRGTPLLPITFAVCDFDTAIASGGQQTIYLPKHAPAGYAETCERPYGSDENIMPAGFGFLGTGCRTAIDLASPWVRAQTGASVPGGCSQADMERWIGNVILLPVFDRCRTGKSGEDDCDYVSSMSPSVREYRIHAFAAWRLDGYYLSNTYKGGTPLPCGPPRKCVRGEFVEWVELGQDFEIGPAPDTDTLIIRFAG